MRILLQAAIVKAMASVVVVVKSRNHRIKVTI